MMARARPLLGTLVSIQVDGAAHAATAIAAMEAAFAVVAHIGEVMSAHRADSDLGRMSRAHAGQVLSLDPHTMRVMAAARYWSRASGGAFHPVKAAAALVRRGARPGLQAQGSTCAHLGELQAVSATQVRMPGPLPLDLGGIAKGYAVDRAIEVLAAHGVSSAIVNAGGDMRSMGSQGFAVDVRHAGRQLRDHALPGPWRLQGQALATSVAEHPETGFVTTVPRRRPWRSATVMAADCLTADVLTKWALQSSLLCPPLKAAMRLHHARMWRTE